MGSRLVLGWREWVELPDLGIDRIKAKLDTGARSSALHAYDLDLVEGLRGTVVRFKVHPIQRNTDTTVETEAPLLEKRWITSSNGHRAQRPVVLTTLAIAGELRPIELTLTSRDEMGFRMLLGREALRGRFLVDPGRSNLAARRVEVPTLRRTGPRSPRRKEDTP